mmetsp:Transcript_47096/g.108849  ORF Transcript_47096/g.108849 Transcript_47096/m.108849 type:complete len:203 (-) Transcript_47096:188-796(-)
MLPGKAGTFSPQQGTATHPRCSVGLSQRWHARAVTAVLVAWLGEPGPPPSRFQYSAAMCATGDSLANCFGGRPVPLPSDDPEDGGRKGGNCFGIPGSPAAAHGFRLSKCAGGPSGPTEPGNTAAGDTALAALASVLEFILLGRVDKALLLLWLEAVQARLTELAVPSVVEASALDGLGHTVPAGAVKAICVEPPVLPVSACR